MEDRKKRILQAIIDDYVQTAVPVGSRTIARKYLSHLSSATIRNEMSDLEELGYLEQPHVSAGRVPNAKAYRLYVDMLLQGGLAQNEEDDEVRRNYLQRVSHLEDVVASTAQALSDFTRCASIVMMPRQEELRIATLQLVPVSRAMALLVIVTDGGIIRDTMVRVSEALDADALYAISRMLSERFSGRTLKEVQALLKEFAVHAPGDPQVLQGILDLSSHMERQNAADNLTVSGSHNILGFPEYQDADKARHLLCALEDPREGDPLFDGVQLVLRQLTDALGQRGIQAVSRLGEPFDPTLEDAVAQGHSAEGEPGTVCEVVQKGYRMGDSILRHAMVRVVPDL